MKIKQVLNSVNTPHTRRLLKGFYHKKGPGRKPYNPLAILKAQLLKHLLRIPSDRRLSPTPQTRAKKGITQEMRYLEFSDWVYLSVMEFDKKGESWRMAVAVLIMVFTIIGFAVYDRIGLTPTFVAMTGGYLMLTFSGEGPVKALRGIDWSTVIFLAGLFVLVNCLDKNGLIDMLSDWMLNFVHSLPVNVPTAVMWLSAVPSGVVDNIPLTATLAPVMSRWIQEGASADVWWGLVLGANLGGCLTPIGSPSSIIAIGIAEQEGHPIPLGRFTIICIVVTMVNLLVSTIYLYFI